MTGSCKCRGKRCTVCLNVNETSTFTSSVTQEIYKINNKFDCNNKCLVNFINLQTMLEIIRQSIYIRFPISMEQLQSSETCLQEHLFRHFSSPGHNGFLNDVLITFINHTDSPDPPKREDYWRWTLKTMAPFGLNIEGSAWSRIMVIDDTVIIYIYLAFRLSYCFRMF